MRWPKPGPLTKLNHYLVIYYADLTVPLKSAPEIHMLLSAQILSIRECTPRISRDFNEEYPKLRIFSHPNVMPVIGCCNAPPNLVVISQFMPVGSLFQVGFSLLVLHMS